MDGRQCTAAMCQRGLASLRRRVFSLIDTDRSFRDETWRCSGDTAARGWRRRLQRRVLWTSSVLANGAACATIALCAYIKAHHECYVSVGDPLRMVRRTNG